MIVEILSKLNFFDYIIIIVLFRVCYIATKTGLSIEVFKLLGVIFSTYIGLHYYTILSDLIQRRFFYDAMPLAFMDFIIFVLIIIIGYVVFIGLRSLLFRFIQLNAVPKINQFAGLVLGIGRGFLVIGLLSFALAISTVNYFSAAVKYSYLGSRALTISPQTYSWLWNNIFSKFSVREKFNPTVTEITDKFNRP